jgi:cell division protease FtsH
MYLRILLFLNLIQLSYPYYNSFLKINVKLPIKCENAKLFSKKYNNNKISDEHNNQDDCDDNFGSELEDIIYKKKKNIKPEEFGIRIFFPIGKEPDILKKHLKEKENENKNKNKKSENFELIFNKDFNFTNIGGYDLIKTELLQCADILVNCTKYEKYNVRIPKGLILEGPPGNGKTILTKAFSGEINVGFIPVSGSQFQEMYVGVGASRVRELFDFAKANKPCIIFIDEIDAIGRKRSTDTESSSSERDSTLNELLVALDGFKQTNGIFLIGATNRIDLLDNALVRPGRIDKKIYVGNPDKKTRKEILNIHLRGKPYNENIHIDKLVEMTNGFSGAEIENLLNEAMLLALRENREIIDKHDLEIISNRILTGWQITENQLSQEMITQIAIHEIGHALTSIFTNYKKIIKVSINLWSPKALGFTLFDESVDNIISTKENLIKEIMVLLGGRVAEEIFYGEKISSGAVDDFHRVKNIIQKMVLDYGMGTNLFLPYNSDKYREKIDTEIEHIFNEAYDETKYLLNNSKQLVKDCANLLIIENEITEEQIKSKINGIYDYLIKK